MSDLSLLEIIFYSSLSASVLLWFVHVIKLTLFYLYLWQTKEYRIERFVDLFRSAKSRNLIVNKFLFAELLILLLPFSPFLILLYGFDGFKTGFHILQKGLRKPVFTKKAALLSALNVLAASGFVILLTQEVFQGSIVRFLVLYSIFVPVIVSVIVIALQPVTIFIRKRRLAKAMAKRAALKNLKVVGITGSYGKTTTKEFLAHILSAKFNVVKTPEHQNSEFGVANTILNNLTEEHEVFVCEMGAYKKGEIKILAEVAQPHIGVVTGVNEQHLATFGSFKNLHSAEGGRELIASLPKDGIAILNGESEKLKIQIPNAKKTNNNLKFVIVGEDMQAENVIVEKEKVSFESLGVRFVAPAYGGHNTQNLLLAIAAAKEMGMTMQEIARMAETMPLEASSLKVKKSTSGVTIIDSTYSANPDGVIADLAYLNLYKGRKVVIMPCLIELGDAAKEAHRRIGKKIAEVCDLAIITTKEYFEDIQESAGQTEVVYTANSQAIVEKIKDADAVLLEGGKESRLQLELLRMLHS